MQCHADMAPMSNFWPGGNEFTCRAMLPEFKSVWQRFIFFKFQSGAPGLRAAACSACSVLFWPVLLFACSACSAACSACSGACSGLAWVSVLPVLPPLWAGPCVCHTLIRGSDQK